MSEGDYSALRTAILAPRPGDDEPETAPTRRRAAAFFRDLWPRGGPASPSDPAGSIFELPLTRKVSGWGALVGAGSGFMTSIPNLPAALFMLLVGGIAGSFLAVTALVAISGLVHRAGVRAALIILLIVAAVVVWFFLPQSAHPQL